MSISCSTVGPLAARCALLEVRVTPTHVLARLAGALAEHDRDDVKEQQHRGLVQAAHREDARLRASVVRHGLRAEVDHRVDRLRHAAVRLRGDRGGACALCLCDADERRDSRERPGPGADEEEVAPSERRRGHVADDVRVEPEVHQPHAEGAHHQALAADTVGRDPLRLQDLVAEPIDLRSGAFGLEHSANLVERAAEKVLRPHRAPLPAAAAVCSRSFWRFAPASPPSKTALPATIMSTPIAATEAALSRVMPPSTASMTSRPLRAIRSRAWWSRRSVFPANRWPPHPGLTASTSTSSRSSSNGSIATTGVPGFSATPRVTLEPSTCRTRCGWRVAST